MEWLAMPECLASCTVLTNVILKGQTSKKNLFNVCVYMYVVFYVCVGRGRAYCKILCKYCIFGCRTHFSHIAASPYTKWLNTGSASYSSLVAAVSLKTRSICKLCDFSRGSAFPPSTTSPVNEGWNLDYEINAQAAIIFVCMALPPPPPPITDLYAL